jgi:UDP-N-acetylglucosamine 2-epimerase (non-hydrolysing)
LKKIRLAVVFGTRPEAIKMAPVVLAARRYKEYIDPAVIVTAQHREMLDQALEFFRIEPDFDLDIMRERQSLYDITSGVLKGLTEVFSSFNPDLVLVHGDTTTTFVSALAAFYRKTPIGHVEAGLRTDEKYSPFPEEMNRRLTGALSDLHFAPTETARANLLRENIKAEKIFVTGNTVIDALRATVRDDYEFTDPTLAACVNGGRKIILLTAHRRENLGAPLRETYRALAEAVRRRPDVEVIFPVHKNPAVRDTAREELRDEARVHMIDPLEYAPFANLMARAFLVLSDSGGVQEEAPALGKPVLVLRDTTERPEALRAGTVKLIGTKFPSVLENLLELLENGRAYRAMAEAVNPYGDGLAADRIIRTLLYQRGCLPEPPAYFGQAGAET